LNYGMRFILVSIQDTWICELGCVRHSRTHPGI
jgi:hypothetical protein